MEETSEPKTITPDQLRHTGRAIETWRRDHGRMTQRDFAARMGVSVGVIQSLEKGTRATRIASLKKIAERMQVALETLLNETAHAIGFVHPDPRVAALLPDDVEIAIMYQRAPGQLKIEIRQALERHYGSIDPRYRGALEGTFSRKVEGSK